MTIRRVFAVLIAAALASGGCLQKDVTETWYLEPDGGVTWVVMEKDVRSDAQAEADRRNEEETYYQDVMREVHPAARGFRALGAAKLRTRILRSEIPFTVVTEGRFAALDDLGQQIISMSGLAGTSILTRDGAIREWTFTIRDPHAEDPRPNEDVVALLGDLDTLQVVLVTGRFERAQLFELSSDRRVAKLDRSQLKDMDETATITLKLKWTASK
jgi:hypothetical protein